MKFFFIVIISLVIGPDVFSQSGWQTQGPLPTINALTSTFFIDENTGYAAGHSGTII